MKPFYDVTKTYEDNYNFGPFGDFTKDPRETVSKLTQSKIFDIPLDIPFGIPAGPLLNGKFVQAAWKWGYSLATYKTVRNIEYPCHPFPNIIKVQTHAKNIKPGDTVVASTDMDTFDVMTEGITNSFGVPSMSATIWSTDIAETLKVMKKGTTLIVSFMGTKIENMSKDAYIESFISSCILAKNTGAPILEVNFSCPNVGKEGLICTDVDTSRTILQALHKVKGNTPLLVKIGYFSHEQKNNLDQLLTVIHQYADGVSAINTIQAKVVNNQGNQALPGGTVRAQSGICGVPIKWAGLEMAQNIIAWKQSHGIKDFTVIGVGGVTSVADYFVYKKIGVDAVQSATGAMWRPNLAIEIKKGSTSI